MTETEQKQQFETYLIKREPAEIKGLAEICVLCDITYDQYLSWYAKDNKFKVYVEKYKTFLIAWAENKLMSSAKVGNIHAIKMILEQDHPMFKPIKKKAQDGKDKDSDKALDELQKLISDKD